MLPKLAEIILCVREMSSLVRDAAGAGTAAVPDIAAIVGGSKFFCHDAVELFFCQYDRVKLWRQSVVNS